MSSLPDPRRARIHAAVDALLDALHPEPPPPPSPAVSTPAPMVSKQEAARHFNVSTATIDRLCKSGEIPYVVIGDSRRFDLAAVRAALEARNVSQPKAPPLSTAPEMSTGGVRCVSRGQR